MLAGNTKGSAKFKNTNYYRANKQGDMIFFILRKQMVGLIKSWWLASECSQRSRGNRIVVES